MTIKFPIYAEFLSDFGVRIKPVSGNDWALLRRFFDTKEKREAYNKKEFYPIVTFELPYQKRTYSQNRSVWLLVTIIFQSMEGRSPDEVEKKELYLDLLDLYADKVPNKLNGKLRPVHISESNSLEGSRLIDGLLYHIATMCELDYDAQSSVSDMFLQWENWKGKLERDPSDYDDLACDIPLNESKWRERHPYSEASGKGGSIHLHHIISRGANKKIIHEAWNWLALTPDEHQFWHNNGAEHFLSVYPHLTGKVNRARSLAGKLDTTLLAVAALE
jgi:hypothetical protein